jgi:hypothetical protein
VLTGTLKERADAPAALIGQINNIAQLRGRDRQGRVPVDLELALQAKALANPPKLKLRTPIP